MNDEIAKLRLALEEERRRREEEQRRREEEQRRREKAESLLSEEQRRREEAEEAAKASQPLQLPDYIEACHKLSLNIKVVTDPALTTQGDTTDPVGRVYPRRILRWDDFPAKQEEIWDKLFDSSFASRRVFPSQHQLDYVQSVIQPISCEYGLRHYERGTVENAVQKLVEAVYEDPLLRDRLGLRGTVIFESHTNLATIENSVSERSESTPRSGESARTSSAPARKRARLSKGKRGQADQFCIYRTSDGAHIPALAIEYKAPHKLSTEELVTGLVSEIQPERDVINKDGSDFVFAAKTLTAAVITQLFSYMVRKGIRYGYVCTGQAFVFLNIPDDPTVVYHYLCVPNQDVLDDDENRLHRTAVAQVFAFIIQALHTAPPSLSWYDAAKKLDTWAMEYDDILSKIPLTVRKEKVRASPYKPQRWRGFTRSPIRTRSYCRQSNTEMISRNDDDEEGAPPSPSAHRQTRSQKKAATSGTGSGTNRARDDKKEAGQHDKTEAGQHDRKEASQGGETRQRIQDAQYCTHQCLRGVISGEFKDHACPNAAKHGPKHISKDDFLRLLRDQLAKDRGPEPDCIPLSLSGAVGLLFKIRLSAYGYTLVAKGVETENLWRLRHEKTIYDRVSHIQGEHVPVCVGLIDLVLPYYFDGYEFEHFLLLSWAGQPLSKYVDKITKSSAIHLTTKAYTELHRLHVLHCDAEPRNLLYDASNDRVMVVDFERATLHQPLGSISPNTQRRKRKRGSIAQKQGNGEFEKELEKELQYVVKNVSIRFGDNQPSGRRPPAS
ncbi:hypothetical protein MYCTH_2299494 [Thermothelomyces thermophilus ATCC 42464]|uniref:Protein kinase domain-containing protein n=1 Tax=Thermothelomyces thermophilus (strain ATCC 42464 / BCRC 31852 / DSM 1799) TaxID=573729 RepID=G2Q660_THET4|nr:uncharacterized protein MYCTH_2299494 [Thermothelomyces thermophilus ATCC 42464]AEO55539.1 hypothetical protein MYCTH_2299494 [Thermothelomyces thermophilus ATCC 42464]